jgi:WD40 repeat protein
MVLSGSQDQRLILWDLDSGEEVLTLEGHSGGVASAAISPDSKTALSAGNDQLVILWDLETGREIRRFVGHIKTSFGLAYLPDGRHALSGDYYGDIIMWRLTDTDTEVIAWAYKNRHIREFTCLERERYNIEPGCPGDGQPVPTRTPYPTLTANPAHSVTPILDVARTTVTRIWTPIATPTGAPTFTPLPTATLEAVGQLTPGVPHVGQIIAGRGDQPSSRDRWTYDGSAGEVINITNQSLGVSIDIFDPSGELLAESSTPGVGPLLLPATGTYTIVVYAGSNSMGGQYTLTLTTE